MLMNCASWEEALMAKKIYGCTQAFRKDSV